MGETSLTTTVHHQLSKPISLISEVLAIKDWVTTAFFLSYFIYPSLWMASACGSEWDSFSSLCKQAINKLWKPHSKLLNGMEIRCIVNSPFSRASGWRLQWMQVVRVMTSWRGFLGSLGTGNPLSCIREAELSMRWLCPAPGHSLLWT